ncbi:hypothetical protein LJR289_002456 [Pseudoduganella sp. LjRoot289]|uniref:hypothetical protein n=1 Tax=Pseudoduganella sp. LjRoot289 TaxID=3342314 RepID=UPI003ED0730A
MKHRDGIFATIALTLSSFALAGMMYTDVYLAAAGTEVRGVNALTHEVMGGGLAGRADGLASAKTAAVQQ